MSEKLKNDVSLGRPKIKVGLLGELLVQGKLIEQGWHPVRLDTSQMAANADIIAINKEKRVSIQVKTTNAVKRHSHSDYLGFGYTSKQSISGGRIFNSKASPLIADVVIAVSYKKPESEFVILPVGMAENLCAKHIQYWKSIKKKDGGKHDAFPIFLSFSSSPKAHAGHHKFIRDHILKFRNRWDILDLSPEKLRDPRGWKVS